MMHALPSFIDCSPNKNSIFPVALLGNSPRIGSSVPFSTVDPAGIIRIEMEYPEQKREFSVNRYRSTLKRMLHFCMMRDFEPDEAPYFQF